MRVRGDRRALFVCVFSASILTLSLPVIVCHGAEVTAESETILRVLSGEGEHRRREGGSPLRVSETGHRQAPGRRLSFQAHAWGGTTWRRATKRTEARRGVLGVPPILCALLQFSGASCRQHISPGYRMKASTDSGRPRHTATSLLMGTPAPVSSRPHVVVPQVDATPFHHVERATYGRVSLEGHGLPGVPINSEVAVMSRPPGVRRCFHSIPGEDVLAAKTPQKIVGGT